MSCARVEISVQHVVGRFFFQRAHKEGPTKSAALSRPSPPLTMPGATRPDEVRLTVKLRFGALVVSGALGDGLIRL